MRYRDETPSDGDPVFDGHGDGSWTCVGPDGLPLPTIRLENFRDGLEDYAYAVILGTIVHRREAKLASLNAEQKQWLADARQALVVPETLVRNMKDYASQPDAVYAWRDRMAELIERGGDAGL